MAELYFVEQGAGAMPVVLLHGFGGSHAAWTDVLSHSGEARRFIAFDLPGHGRSLDVPSGSAATVARSILEWLQSRAFQRVHLVGHSLGGAASAVMALMDPGRVASLTLFAPGGFGSEIDYRLLRRYAAATGEPELAPLLEQFFGWESVVPRELAGAQARQRRVPGATAALLAIVETFFDGDRQKTIPLENLARLPMPIKIVWGTQDRVLPARQAHKLSGRIAVHIFERIGHMLPYEIPEDAARLILENTR